MIRKPILLTATLFVCTWLHAGEAEYNLRVCAQNLKNYYYNYTWSDRPDYDDEYGFADKTRKIVNAILTIDADIYAFCELEATPIVLDQLVDSLNKYVGDEVYESVFDGIDYTPDSYDNHLKSGFLFRNDRVRIYGNNTPATSTTYYKNTMRIQTFTLKSNGERLVVSMNHFKAKDNSSDAGEGQRMKNANNLLSALQRVSADPDILVLGDLNCEYGENPIMTLINAGYEEQLLRFDSSAYSHCYGGGELIDHVLANESMAVQVVNAYVYHNCTHYCTSGVTRAMSYSDHDPYVVEIMLGDGESVGEGISDVMHENKSRKVLIDGQLYILYEGRMYNVQGARIR